MVTDETCPGCECHNPSTEHLEKEYLSLARARFDRMFGHNAARAQAACGRMLVARGVRSIANIFGPIEVRTD